MKRGSALLIVLGMIAFMVISAVAFSAFMRNSRLPSSYLRRTSYSRLLVKAALAEAIDLIDISIGDNPHPGVGTRAYPYPRRSTANESSSTRQRNYWVNRVFIGTNSLMNADQTVSTLTFEALAYLPPALINETRYYSRRSAAACWHNLGFDSGRYAFTAVDVSDHFDINRIFADRGRNSSDTGRITLAHVFENGSPSAANWDDFISEFNDAVDVPVGQTGGLGANHGANQSASKLPLVSLADMNLAINKKGWANTMSAFCRYVTSKGSQDFVVSTGGADSEMMRKMAFVTDSYSPSTNNADSAKYDLCFSQPFTRVDMGAATQQSVEQIIPQSTPMLQQLKNELTGLDIVMLYDYLDGNDVPASLALPSVERVPMVCGLQPRFSFTLEPKPAEKKVQGGGSIPTSGLTQDSPPINVVHSYKMKFSKGPDNKVSALLMFPFRRNEAADQGVSYTVDCAARIGFTIGNGPGLRAPDNSAFVISAADSSSEFQRNGVVEGGVIKLYKQASGTFTPPSSMNGEAQAMSSVLEAPFDLSAIENWFNGNDLFSITYVYKVENEGTQDDPNWQYHQKDPVANSATVNAAFHPLNANGVGDGGFNKAMVESGQAVSIRPFVTVTARVKQSGRSNKYVDLVPASYLDDKVHNNIPTAPAVVAGVSGNQNCLPLVTLGGDNAIDYGVGAFDGTGGQKLEKIQPTSSGGALICPDPRWNFAPENFYAIDEALQSGDWFPQKCGVGEQNRDNDIFMACSNQGYLQSVSEIAFLPRVVDVFGGGNSMLGECSVTYPYGDGTFKTFPGASDAFGALPHGKFMWRTYRLYPQGGLAADPLYDLGVFSSGSGPRVSPYTESPDVMLAALVHTPYSWWAASTNYTADAVGKSALQDLPAEQFNTKYAFCEKSTAPSRAKIDEKALSEISANFVDAFQNAFANGRSWESAYEAEWNSHTGKSDYLDYLCGVDLGDSDELYGVDRKMLYGFWRDSIAPKQQLFLIFVRAEPMMMGGGAIGQTPPQLGARAVALVWRDPLKRGSENGDPHQTRVLFYRQFD